MRIGVLVLAAGRTAGGPETYEVQLVRALARIDSGNSYFVYCTSREAVDVFGALPDNFTLRVLEPSVRALSLSLALPRWIARDRVDLLHATYAPPPTLSRPLVFTMHCMSNFAHPEYYPLLIRWRLNGLQRKALRRAKSILCVSGFVAERLRADFRIEPQRLRTIYNGVGDEFTALPRDTARARVAERFGISTPYVLYVGKLQARKNVVGLIQAFARYRNETGSQAKLVLAGKRVETSEGISEAVATLGLRDYVVELGYVAPPPADPLSALPCLYAAAEMTVLPSFYEGFGLPVVEAMACGCPVIASNVTSIPEIAGGAAVLFDPRSVQEMAAAMVRIRVDPAERSRLIESGLRRARSFTWENCARQTLEAYCHLRGT